VISFHFIRTLAGARIQMPQVAVYVLSAGREQMNRNRTQGPWRFSAGAQLDFLTRSFADRRPIHQAEKGTVAPVRSRLAVKPERAREHDDEVHQGRRFENKGPLVPSSAISSMFGQNAGGFESPAGKF